MDAGVTGGKNPGKNNLIVNIDEDQIAPEIIKNNWKYVVPTVYSNVITKTDLYLDMKEAKNYSKLEKSGAGITSGTFGYGSNTYWAVLFLDKDLKVIGYVPMGALN
ncbi:hypothetical protein ACIQZI_12585 [Peribacillus sp. NPDC096379]|uniref:hypothetical protein n=1 Tax=Peribacillus sp. NPDC096379 TaxID=3364393 RepID=UPI0038173402